MPQGVLRVHRTQPKSVAGFGHTFYMKRTFSWFVIRLEYRFTEDKSTDGFADWTYQNSGIMVHAQNPATAPLNADFPNSVEVQLLGPKATAGGAKGTTMNLCTPGTFVAFEGKDTQAHCIIAKAHPTSALPWIPVSAVVYGDSMIIHTVEQDTVLRYTKTRYDGGAPARDGWIALQDEGTSMEFRKVQILDLVGCMDKASPHYKAYYRKHDADACSKPVTAKGIGLAPPIRISGSSTGLWMNSPHSIHLARKPLAPRHREWILGR
jgi:hypothetical protein